MDLNILIDSTNHDDAKMALTLVLLDNPHIVGVGVQFTDLPFIIRVDDWRFMGSIDNAVAWIFATYAQVKYPPTGPGN